ncbi:hypothetical protein, partial [Sinorhizobium meliloti]|uniref:hypothetical protein n=1 Tax=Rhizobium meliloti TaxID=382 RepID=UPI001AEC79C8
MILSSLWLEMDAGVPISAPSSSPASPRQFCYLCVACSGLATIIKGRTVGIVEHTLDLAIVGSSTFAQVRSKETLDVSP